MGTVLHCIIEEKSERSDNWYERGTWKFEKFDELITWLSDNSKNGWPKDSKALTDPQYEIFDECRQWVYFEDLDEGFDQILTCEKTNNAFVVNVVLLDSLLCALDRLDQNRIEKNVIRILFYRC